MSFPGLTLDVTTADRPSAHASTPVTRAGADAPVLAGKDPDRLHVDEPAIASHASIWVLLLGGLVTAFGVLMSFVDVPHTHGWELFHWNAAALTAVAATALSVRGSRGLTRRIRQGSMVAMILWLLTNVTWAGLVASGTATFPSIADVFVLLLLVPGTWMLVTTMHGRLSPVEESAVYLDDCLVVLATTAVLVALFGPTALAIGGTIGLLVVLYPTLFIGAAATTLVGIFATRQTLRAKGGVAIAIGTGLIGIAYIGWLLPTAVGGIADNPLDVLFAIGPLVAAYGAISWGDQRIISASRVRLAGRIGWSIGPIAVFVVAISTIIVHETPEIDLFLQFLTAVAVVLLLIRLSLHLHERGENLEEVRRLSDENEVLVGRLRRRLEERERAHARLVDASRMAAVGELAAAVAHEVNNPLTGVLGYTELLLADTNADPRMRADLEVIRSEALRVRDRVRALMDFAAPRRPELVSSDVATVVGGPIGLLLYHLDRRGISLEERHEPMPPADLDPPSIQQVVINIISDMAGAMPRGGRITISTAPAGDHALIAIEADAPEVDIGALESAFRPFDDDPGEIPGSKRIAASLGVLRGHDATIGLRHEPGAHPRVEIHLPYHAAVAVD